MTLCARPVKIYSAMKKYFSVFFIVGALLIHGSANAYVERDTAVVRIMNKAAGKAQTVTLPVGQRRVFEKLDMTVRTCKQTDPFQAEDFFMFIEISDGKPVFGGWMSKNAPGDNPLQHPDYDVWLVRCE